MRKLLLLLFLASNAHAFQGYVDVSVTLGTSTEAQQVSSTQQVGSSCYFMAPSSNGGPMYISPSSVNATVNTAIEMATGTAYRETATKPEVKIDLSDWYFNSDTTGDRLIVHCVE